MNKTILNLSVRAAIVIGCVCPAFAEQKIPSPESVKAITKKVADWQVETFEDQVQYRAVSSSKRKTIEELGDRKPKSSGEKYAFSFTKKWHDSEWHNAALYAGMNEWRKVADDPKPYTQWLRSIGERNGWKPHWRKYNADDHAVGHYYLALYEEFNKPEMIGPLQERFDWIIENPKTGSLEMKKGTDADDRWGWCDALFMAPPVWARMAKVTGKQKYLDFMDQEYHATYDLLWSKEHQLFFRDSRYFTRSENNGAKIFWSRGNGWVFSGLALMIPDLPKDWEGRPFYIDTFKQMAETLKKTQRVDGTWSMGLLGDPKDFPIPETSGTSFFTHGLAWGINNGLLDRATYEPVVLKAWAALTACVTEEGLLGHVQPVGAAPGESYPDKTEVYGVGAFLAAGAEVYTLVGRVPTPSPEAVKALTKKVADWQIETFEDQIKYRAQSAGTKKAVARYWKNPDDPKYKSPWSTRRFANKWHDLEWHNGALYAGMNQWRKVSGDPNAEAFLMKIGTRNDWNLFDRPYHADDHAVGQFYLSLYEEKSDLKMLKPTKKQFDWILANPKTGTMEWKAKPTDAHNRWGWCDALFMAPPVWARLAKVTGEQKYLDFMDQEYRVTYDLLWDKEDHFFWRDTSYFKKREANGRKLYWARGNGWVFGGLALMIPDLPEDWEGRQFYIDLYKKMAESLKNCQRADGTWSMGLLGGVEGYPIKETSGTSFYTFGLAWGINNGILDPAVYGPVVIKAWNALTECITPEGMLGYVQPVGAAPGDSFPDKTEVYGIGAFLAAGSEVYKMVGGGVATQGKEVAQHFTTFMKDGGWCWYQDPRAIIHDGKLFMGSVKGNGTGAAYVGVYDLEAGKALGNVLMQDKFDRDDHNSPVFHVRPDGSVLAIYAKHNRDKFHYSRISDPADPLKWSAEFKHARTSPNPKDKVTYMNLYEMKEEGKLYNFYRGINFNPTFVTSTDHGKTWAEPVHFFKNEVGGRHRPYARYAGNGKDTVYVSITDAHPRNYGNSLYYFEFRDGNYFKADGTLIKALKDGPLLPSEAEKVYKGSEVGRGNAHGGSVPNSAWTSSIAIDAKGYPHIGYTLYLSNTDHRYRIASWDGSTWIDREVAFAGKCLYTKESSYTGLITLDPTDPTQVCISSDVDPSTGKDLGGTHEIYAGRIGLSDNRTTIKWKAVTSGSDHRNIRPAIVTGGGYKVLLWQSGVFNTYMDYDLDVKGIVLERP